jgi:hypothetical protein
MMNIVFEDVDLEDTGKFEKVLVTFPPAPPKRCKDDTMKLVSKCMYGNAACLPLTFCFLPSNHAFPLWDPPTLQEFVKTAKDEELRGVLFQIVWTLAVLQRTFPGFQHHDLPKSIRLVSFPKSRSFRVGGMRGGYTFVIPSTIPLPVIEKCDMCDALEPPLPVRSSSTPSSDLQDVLDVFSAVSLSIQNDIPIQDLLFTETFDDFLSKGVSSTAVAHIPSFS